MPDLRQRKQEETRKRIAKVAMGLFATDGFDAVTVSKIAEAASVGRMTLFRYYGDKFEVVFAHETEVIDRIAYYDLGRSLLPGSGLATSLELARDIALDAVGHLVIDGPRFRQYYEIVASSPELELRALAKLRALGAAIGRRLEAAGATPEIALLAAGISAACYDTGLSMAGGDPSSVIEQLSAAFDRVIALGAHPLT